ncbi:hypothetical protein EVAR_10374_1 [Eumeta japonica]|uniref:Uncharacterized protein n=1 Tax=Eumeta variegata TaxID=151549 RepID=A0A4C1UDE2_EUMVA|nr:hypothetical protein EVAR_10374_1 [Eumeta japonica]
MDCLFASQPLTVSLLSGTRPAHRTSDSGANRRCAGACRGPPGLRRSPENGPILAAVFTHTAYGFLP